MRLLGMNRFITVLTLLITSREMLENLNDKLFHSCMNLRQQVLRDSQMSQSDITDIVLVGGSTRIILIQHLLQEYFNGKQPSRGLDTDESVAYCAAVQTKIIKVDNDEKLNGSLKCLVFFPSKKKKFRTILLFSSEINLILY
jgi:molecular chaperone DnaK (HSP70)